MRQAPRRVIGAGNPQQTGAQITSVERDPLVINVITVTDDKFHGIV
ncbi:MAG TPA: hypothetical protein VKM93_25685 [Terriglobia bacterium]|nr:hypothetical protein [Terriglobia bacterium]